MQAGAHGADLAAVAEPADGRPEAAAAALQAAPGEASEAPAGVGAEQPCAAAAAVKAEAGGEGAADDAVEAADVAAEAVEKDGDAEEAEEGEEEMEEAPDTAEALQLAAAHRDRCGRRLLRRRSCSLAATEPVIAQALLGRARRPVPPPSACRANPNPTPAQVPAGGQRARQGGRRHVRRDGRARGGHPPRRGRLEVPLLPGAPRAHCARRATPPRRSAAPHARLLERERRRKRGGPGSHPGVACAASTGAAAAHCALATARPLQHGRAVRGQCRSRPAPAGQAGRGRRGAGPAAAGHGARIRGGPVLDHALLLRWCAGPASGAVSLEAPLVSLDRNLPLVRICRLAN